MNADLIGRIYECALAPDLWPGVLDEIGCLAGGRGAIFYVANASAKTLRWISSPAVRCDAEAYFAEKWYRNDRRWSAVLEASHPGFLTETDLYRSGEFEADPTISGFHSKRGSGRVVVTRLAMPAGDGAAFSVQRDLSAGPASSAVVAWMDALRPHVARSILMSCRLQMERARMISESLSLMGIPALVFDARGRVLAANALIDGLAAHIFWGANDAFALRDKRANAQLQDAILQLGADDRPSVRSFAVREAVGAAPLAAHVVPVRGTARDVFSRCAGILVLAPVTMPNAAPLELLASLFDLSPAEARVARKLIAGDTVGQIAAANRVSGHTVRTQVRRVLEKTGCRRQTEVVALLGGVAAPPR